MDMFDDFKKNLFLYIFYKINMILLCCAKSTKGKTTVVKKII